MRIFSLISALLFLVNSNWVRAQENNAPDTATTEAAAISPAEQLPSPSVAPQNTEEKQPAPPPALPPPLTQSAKLDQNAPTIETVMVASSSTASPPIVSAVLFDDRSGVALVEVHWRDSAEAEWQSTPMIAGTGGMFMTRLPLDLSKTGFEYFVVAYDEAGNGPSRYASAETPKKVKASQENTLQRIQRVEPSRTVHSEDSSGWLMFNLVLAVISGGTSTFFWADYFQIEEMVKDDTLPEDYVSELKNAQINDAFIGGVSALATAASLGASIYLMTEPGE